MKLSGTFLKIFRAASVLLALCVFVLGDNVQHQVYGQSSTCQQVLPTNVEVQLDPAYSTAMAGSFTLSAGSSMEYVGQTPDGAFWIVRYTDGYALYPTSSPDLRPTGCQVPLWGAPPPEYRSLDEVMTAVGIDAWHAAGYFGQGVRVGVIDTRFDGLEALLASEQLTAEQVTLLQPLEKLMRNPAEATAPYHGTNVLEVLAAVAPQSQYFIAKAVNADEFEWAVDELIAAGVHIIVHAGNVIIPDPTPYHAAVRRATTAGILWVNSAGNIGAGYYPGRFSGGSGLLPLHQFEDPNRSGLQQGLMVPVNGDGPVSVTLVWEDGRTEQVVTDFDLVVSGNCRLDATGTFQPLSSDNNQAMGNAESSEQVWLSPGDLVQIGDYLTAPSAGVQQACPGSAQPDGVSDNEIYISLFDASRTSEVDIRFDVYVEGALPAAYDPDITQSLDPVVLPPGDIPESLTVGVFDPRANRMAWYSGRYNSLQYYAANPEVDYSEDEIVKPDLVTYGELLLPSGRQFFGTSAATPLVAGAAALVAEWQMNHSYLNIQTLLDMVVGKGVACLNSDGTVGHTLRKLDLPSVSAIDIVPPVACGQYVWPLDLASHLVTNFHEPGFIAAQTEAEHQKEAVLSQRLAHQANELFPDDTDMSLLLSVQALKTSDTPEARNSLFTVLTSLPTQLVAVLHGHIDPDGIRTLAFSPDGRILATGSCGGVRNFAMCDSYEIRLWDTTTYQMLREPMIVKGHDAIVKLAFSPDGRTLASSSALDVSLWEVPAGRLLANIQVESNGYWVDGLAFSPDSHLLASLCNGIILWNINTGEIHRLPLGENVRQVVFVNDHALLGVDDQGTVLLWDIASGTEITEIVPGSNVDELRTTLSSDGRLLGQAECLTPVSADGICSEARIQVIDLGNKEETAEFEIHDSSTFQWNPRNTGYFMFFSPDTQFLIYLDGNTVRMWDVINKQVVETLQHPGEYLEAVAIDPTNRRFASAGGGSDAYLWDLGRHSNLFSVYNIPNKDIPNQPVLHSLAVRPDGQNVMVETEEGHVFLWDIVTDQMNPQYLPVDLIQKNLSAFFSPDGKILATVGWEKSSIILWDTSTFQPLDRTLGFPDDDVTYSDIAFSQNNEFLAASTCLDSNGPTFRCLEGEIRIWDLSTGVIISQITPGELIAPEQVSFSPDGSMLVASVCLDGEISRACQTGSEIYLWDTATHQYIDRFFADEAAIISLSFSPDGKYLLAMPVGNASPILWEMPLGESVGYPIIRVDENSAGVAFSSDGRWLAIGETLWETSSRQLIGEFDFQDQHALDVAFDTNNKTLTILYENDTVLVWQLDADIWVRSACQIANRAFTQEEWQQYMGTEPYVDVCANTLPTSP
ncbi:S8 family serine peptidase [Aggregatilinea lenta]|uniref:S8 family serine peptidase n=1 Tax=Aggregatilinea lenta TaxID=913108 RepID=UPI000E5AF4CF|nr:S8 family serine peptidase [Aggregatilinea lenta]